MPATSAGMTKCLIHRSSVHILTDQLANLGRGAGTRSAGLTFSWMDRLFLAIIVSGVLLACTSMSLLVVTGGGNTVAELKVPPPSLAAQVVRPRMPDDMTLARNESAVNR
jgi:hypothetical protein